MSELAALGIMVEVGLAAAYGYVYLLYRRRAFLFYACAWLSAGGFAIAQRAYAASPQIELLVNAEMQCVFAACLLLGIAYIGRHARGLAVIGAGALFLCTVVAALFVGRLEPSIMARVGTALTLCVAAALWTNAIRFLLVANDDLLEELRPQLSHFSMPVLSTTTDTGMKEGVLPAWRELRLTRRLLVLTFAGLAIAEVSSLVMKTPVSLSVLFVVAIGLKATQGAAVGLWVLADMRTANERLLARSVAEELGVLTASIEHDIKNPLGNLRREIDTASRKYSADRDISERLKQMLRSVERIAVAVNVIPSVREISDDFAQRAHALNAAAVVRDAAQTVKRMSTSDDVRVAIDAARSEFRVNGDHARLQQAFVNILTNGVEAARLAGRHPHIEVDLRTTPDRKGVRVTIRDNGRGMTPEQMGRLGQPFYSSKEGGNRGIGVFMTTRIVKLHRGTVQFQSDGESFTQVEITLPLVEPLPRAARNAS